MPVARERSRPAPYRWLERALLGLLFVLLATALELALGDPARLRELCGTHCG